MSRSGYKVGIVTFPWHGIISWQTSAWCIQTALEMLNDSRISSLYTNHHEGNCPISMLRNIAVKSAMNERVDYLLMIDYDMVPDTKAPEKKTFWSTSWEFVMDRRRREVADSLMPATVAAPYFSDANESFLTYVWNDDPNRSEGDDLALIDHDDALSRTGLGVVTAAQTGLILYDMRVFWYMPRPWFAYEWKDKEQDNVNLADDFYQTRNLTIAGCPVYVAWDCWSGHLKTKCVARPPLINKE